MNSNNGKIAFLLNKYGEEELLHSTRRGWTRKQRTTTLLALNKPIGKIIGERVKHFRLKRGYTLAELCTRTGIVSATPKSRMWEIENCIRSEAMRMGTLYGLAIALEVCVADLLPTVEEVREMCDVRMEATAQLNARELIASLNQK